MPDDIGVGDIVFDLFAARPWRLAKGSGQQTLARLALRLVLRGPHPAVAIAGLAVLDMNGVDHALTEKPVMLMAARRIHRIGTVAVKRTGKRRRQFAVNDELRRIALGHHRREIGLQEWIVRIGLGHCALLPDLAACQNYNTVIVVL